MQLNIVNEKENKLLLRKEVVAEASQFDVTPSRKALQIELEKKLSSKNVVIDKIDHPFGSKVAKVLVNVYATQDALKAYDAPHKGARTEGNKDAQGSKEAKKA